MSLLTICQNVCYLTGISAPTSIVGSTDPLALQLLVLANKAVEKVYTDFCWPTFIKEGSITLATGTAEYATPSDFYSVIPDTEWNSTKSTPVNNPLSDKEWMSRKYGVGVDSMYMQYQIIGVSGALKFAFSPTPSATENNQTVKYRYYSNGWILHTATAQATYTADTDTAYWQEGLVEEELLWTFEKRKTLDYAQDKADAEQARRELYGDLWGQGAINPNMNRKSHRFVSRANQPDEV